MLCGRTSLEAVSKRVDSSRRNAQGRCRCNQILLHRAEKDRRRGEKGISNERNPNVNAAYTWIEMVNE